MRQQELSNDNWLIQPELGIYCTRPWGLMRTNPSLRGRKSHLSSDFLPWEERIHSYQTKCCNYPVSEYYLYKEISRCAKHSSLTNNELNNREQRTTRKICHDPAEYFLLLDKQAWIWRSFNEILTIERRRRRKQEKERKGREEEKSKCKRETNASREEGDFPKGNPSHSHMIHWSSSSWNLVERSR